MKYFGLISLFFCAFSVSAQHFSGEIIYKTTFVPKNTTVNMDSIKASKKGELSSYLITDYFYKSSYLEDGQTTYSYTYHGDTKRMYDEYADKAYITYRDSRKANYEYGTIEVFRDSTINILGYDAYLTVHPSTFGTTKTYYSDALRVNYESFKDHAVGNWYNKLKAVNGSITLKSITEHEEHTEVREAVKITVRKVLPSEFDLPASKPIAASYWALEKQPYLQAQTQAVIDCYYAKSREASKIIGTEESNRIILTAIVNTNGNLSHITPFEKDALGLYKIGVDILENCDLKFLPGEIGGTPVNAEIYFPFDFE